MIVKTFDLITNITNSTWRVPSGWTAPEGYGEFYIDYRIAYDLPDYYPSDGTKLYIGYAPGYSEEDKPVDYQGAVPSENGIVAAGAPFSNDNGLIFTVKGGLDVANARLIEWLKSNNAEHISGVAATLGCLAFELPAGTHSITVKGRASGLKDSEQSNVMHYTYILAPTIEHDKDNATLHIFDEDGNGDMVASYNIYLADSSNPYVGNVLKSGRETQIYLPSFGVGDARVAVKAVDANGNLSGPSNIEGTCFVAGTPVLMADNTYKRIEEVSVGDEVKSYNFKTSAYCKGTVTKVATSYATRIAMVLFEDGSYVAMSEGHPLYTRDGWHSITNKDGYPTLVIGDEVLCQSKYVAIQDIQVVDTTPTMVYSLGVIISNGENIYDGTYFAGVSMTLASHGGGSN